MAERTLQHLLLGTCILVTLSDLLTTVLQPPEIRAEIGKPANLSCNLNYPRNRTIFAKFSKSREEEKDDINGTRSQTCRQLASEEKLFLCEASLKINNTRPEHEGVYYCKIRIPEPEKSFLGTGNGTKLSVYAEPSSVDIKQPGPLVSGDGGSVTCSVSGFYPRNISVLWSFRGQQVPLSNVIFETKKSSDGTFQLHSEFRFRPTAADNRAECSCTVSHPYWMTRRTASIPLNVEYGPSLVTVTTSLSDAVINGAVRVEMGSQLKLTCVADGNPKPSAKWLQENTTVVHTTETLHIPQVQKEHEGLYWCVVNNKHGEKNTSVHLLVLSRNSGPSMKLIYSFVVVLVAFIIVSILFTFRRRRMAKDVQDSQDPHPHSPTHPPMTNALYEETDYATPKKRKKKTHQPKPAQQTVDQAQLIYADITFTSAPSNVITMNESKMSIYSDVGIKTKRRNTQEQNEEGVQTIYAVAQHPLNSSMSSLGVGE